MATTDSTSRAPQRAGPEDARSTGEIAKDVVDGVTTIVRKHIELAKLEIQEAVGKFAQAAALGAAAGVLALYMLGFLLVAGAKGLEEVWPPWLAWLTVAIVLLIIIGALLLAARSRVRNTSLAPERTQESVRENVQWAQQQLRR